jgi:hypothetical protein
MADADVVRPLGEPMDAEALDKLKIVSRREFDLIMGKSNRRLKAYLQAMVGTTRRPITP